MGARGHESFSYSESQGTSSRVYGNDFSAAVLDQKHSFEFVRDDFDKFHVYKRLRVRSNDSMVGLGERLS